MSRARRRSLPRAARDGACVALALAALIASPLGRRALAQTSEETAPAGPAAAPLPTPEPEPMGAPARERYEEGLRLYGARDFAGAIRLFEEGFALEPRREFLFAEAQAQRLAGNCAGAVPLYHRFLATTPSDIQVDATRLALDRCAKQEAAVGAARASASPATTRDPATVGRGPGLPPQPISPPSRSERRPWWQDPPGLLAAGLGVAALGVGAGYWVASNRSLDQASSPSTPNVIVYDRLHDTAVERRTIAIAAVSTGAVVLAAGVARLVYVRRRALAPGEPRSTSDLALAPTAGGATLLWQGRY